MFPYKIIDLTHCLEPSMPSWNGTCGFMHDVKLDYDTCTTPVKFKVQQIKMHAGVGTHIDAPAHCCPDGKTVEKINLDDLICECIVINVSHKANEDYSVSLKDIKDFEDQYGLIPRNSFVIIYTGWESRWKTPKLYMNNYCFPAISEEVALYLLERGINGLGSDTPSPDRPQDGFFPVHRVLLGAGKYIVENVANALELPVTGGFTACLPMKTTGGTEAPVRLIGLIDKYDT